MPDSDNKQVFLWTNPITLERRASPLAMILQFQHGITKKVSSKAIRLVQEGGANDSHLLSASQRGA